MTLEDFANLDPSKRIDYVRANEDWYRNLSDEDRDLVGTLVCHASTKRSRLESPIIGDYGIGDSAAQEEFETSIFGDVYKIDNTIPDPNSIRGEMPAE